MGFPKALMPYSTQDAVFASLILLFFSYWKSKITQNKLLPCGLSCPPGNHFGAQYNALQKKANYVRNL